MALTLRLSLAAEKELQEIQDELDIATASGTLKHMIYTYMELRKELGRTEGKLKTLKIEHNLQSETLRQVKSTFKMLCDL